MKIKACLDFVRYYQKPEKREAAKISQRLAKHERELELQEIADRIGNHGRTFCPAIFSGEKRIAKDFLEAQLLVLDFDGGVAYEKVKEIAKEYGLPISFAYYTFSSTKETPRFRIVFVNDVRITDQMAYSIMLQMLLRIFDGADMACKDISRMFYGGKGLIGDVNEETINIIQLAIEFQRCLFQPNDDNYSRAVQRFAKRNNISCVNNVLQIECVHENGKTEGFSALDPYIYTSNVVFPSEMPEYIIHTGYQPNVHKRSEDYMLVRAVGSDVDKKCQLYHEFQESPHIHHNLRFLLLTNMIHIEGGAKKFLSVISTKGYDNNKWRFYVKYAKAKEYKPQSCEGDCPYAKECNHKTNMVLTVKEKEVIVKTENEEYYPIEMVYDHICTSLKDAISSTQKGIHLIPAQTAIGKTEAYCRMIQACEQQRFIVAVPTNALKREVGNRLKKYGVEDVWVTPSLDEMNLPKDLAGEISFLHEAGLSNHVAEILRRYIKENKDSQDTDVIMAVYDCKKYLCAGAELREKRVVVMTHARLAMLTEDIVKRYEVIIDEDILSTFFKNIREVKISEVEKALELRTTPLALKERLEQILRAKEGRYEKFAGDMSYTYISREEIEREEICGDVNSISVASSFQKNEDTVYYFYPQNIPKGKYIVLSATLNEALYRMYFPGWYVKSVPYYRAEYEGKLVQLTAYSMSRQGISDNKEKLLEFLDKNRQGFHIITFLQYERLLGSCGIHFGNAEGIDSLKGENIMVIGTPHQTEFVYKLIGCHLGMSVNGEALAVRKVKSGGYEFCMMTYKEGPLQDLQIYFIRKELEQCIGRARLLRNACKVVVLSNFPCEQAELIQDDYLETSD